MIRGIWERCCKSRSRTVSRKIIITDRQKMLCNVLTLLRTENLKKFRARRALDRLSDPRFPFFIAQHEMPRFVRERLDHILLEL